MTVAPAHHPAGWFGRHRDGVLLGAVALLFAAVAVESLLLYEQRATNRSAQSQSAKLLNAFLEGDTAQVPTASGVAIRLQNVVFKWSDKVYIDADDMAVRAVPVDGATVDFDQLDSFL